MSDSSGVIDVVVLTCGELGVTVANRLDALAETSEVTLVTAPYRQPSRTPLEKLRRSLRYEGLARTLRSIAGRLLPLSGGDGEGNGGESATSAVRPGVEHRRVEAFEAPSTLAWLRDRAPDLGVVAGTHILPASVFDLPRLGSINLHCGKAPEYRGSAPAFWELYNGETEVGITIHEVTEDLDAGRILRQGTIPLDPAPLGDPVDYVERYRSERLTPEGVRLLVETVQELARGTATPVEQDHEDARMYSLPTMRDKRELRRRVERRREGR